MFCAARALFLKRSIRKISHILVKILRCARGLYHLIEKWGDDLAKIGDFQSKILSLVGLYYNFSALRARPLSSHDLNENDNFKKSN